MSQFKNLFAMVVTMLVGASAHARSVEINVTDMQSHLLTNSTTKYVDFAVEIRGSCSARKASDFAILVKSTAGGQQIVTIMPKVLSNSCTAPLAKYALVLSTSSVDVTRAFFINNLVRVAIPTASGEAPPIGSDKDTSLPDGNTASRSATAGSVSNYLIAP